MGDELLKLLPEILQEGVSDVFITAGKVLSVRVKGEIRHLDIKAEDPYLKTKEDVKKFIASLEKEMDAIIAKGDYVVIK